MAVTKRTPSLYAAGKYEVNSPFVLDANFVYTCIAIRSFADIVAQDEDVFVNYYEPYAISDALFLADAAANVSIVTLRAEDSSIIYIPDSYILSFPDISNFAYSHLVLSLDFGALPDNLDLAHLKQQLANTALETLGVNITNGILVHKAPTTDYISSVQHEAATAARLAQITNAASDYQTINALRRTITEQQTIIDALTELAKDNNLLTTV